MESLDGKMTQPEFQKLLNEWIGLNLYRKDDEEYNEERIKELEQILGIDETFFD